MHTKFSYGYSVVSQSKTKYTIENISKLFPIQTRLAVSLQNLLPAKSGMKDHNI